MAEQPEKLGKYNIVGKLGKGAMGEVYKGHDPVLNRHVAIKVIAESLDSDSDLVERFRREAKNAAQLNHPNIITIFDFVEDDGNLYIVMELLDGKDLKELIKSGAPLTMEQILGMMEQIADGLGFAHDNGMVHRDLKPANIHITKKGQVKILDFGLVHESSSDMTKTGHIMGTPNYMSPEQVQGLKVDPRSDIFSLGAVFYELLTRKKPFSADSIHATMFKVVQGDREPLAKYSHLPGQLITMVDRSLDPNPDQRFDDGNDLRSHLRQIRNEVLASGDVDSTLTGRGDATVLTPGPDPGSHPSSPPLSQRSVPAMQSRSGASASSSRGGTMRRRDMTSQSMGATSQPRPVGMYAAGAVLLIAIAFGAYYFTRGGSDSGPTVEELSEALVESQQELMVRSLEQRDYRSALSQAEELLATHPQNTDALRVQQEAREALGAIDAAVAEARAALEQGATAEAAEALGRVLTLDPQHPLGAELHDQLNQHFQSQAETSRAEMESARSQASSAGASSRAEFRAAETQRERASADFNRGEYTNAAQGFLAARDQYQIARSAHQQAESARRAQAERQATAAAEAEHQAQDELKRAQDVYRRLKNQPADAALTQQPSYQRAMTVEETARGYESSGDLAAAARAYESATSHLQSARRELEDALERRAQEQRQAAARVTTTTAPATSSTPTRVQEENAIRQTIANYERAIETKNIDLYRQIKPNMTTDEARRLQASFDSVDSQDVEIAVSQIAIEGDSATVVATRRDAVVIRGRSQNSDTRSQTIELTKSSGSWVIVHMGQ